MSDPECLGILSATYRAMEFLGRMLLPGESTLAQLSREMDFLTGFSAACPPWSQELLVSSLDECGFQTEAILRGKYRNGKWD